MPWISENLPRLCGGSVAKGFVLLLLLAVAFGLAVAVACSQEPKAKSSFIAIRCFFLTFRRMELQFSILTKE